MPPDYDPLKKYSIFDENGQNISKLPKFQKALIELDGGNNKTAWETVNKSIRSRCWICFTKKTGKNMLINYNKVKVLITTLKPIVFKCYQFNSKLERALLENDEAWLNFLKSIRLLRVLS